MHKISSRTNRCRLWRQAGSLLLAVACSYANASADDALSFERQTVDSTVQIGYGLAIGHVNDDGRPDILLVDKSEIAWYENPGQQSTDWPRHVMAENLTQRDNVCIAARDLDGDGLVEVAVGARWNPGETTDPQESGAVFYLQRPKDPAAMWKAIPLVPHDPTVHRMHWIQWRGKALLTVLPLHGLGNQGGQGEAVRLLAYDINLVQPEQYDFQVLAQAMHMTHNFDVTNLDNGTEILLVAGREGIIAVTPEDLHELVTTPQSAGAGEVRRLRLAADSKDFVAIEPMHGSNVVHYAMSDEQWTRTLIDDQLSGGHGLACADLLGSGKDQIVAGWRQANPAGKVGIKLYQQDDEGSWSSTWIDDNQMACEDLKVADLNGDGRLDIIAAGRATNNLVIYWNNN